MSPFKKITQQLGALDLKSPDLEDFATPMGPAPDLWPQIKQGSKSGGSLRSAIPFNTKSPSSTDINAIASIQNSVKNYTQTCRMTKFPLSLRKTPTSDTLSCSLPVNVELMPSKTESSDTDDGLRFSETHFDVNGDISTITVDDSSSIGPPSITETLLSTNDNESSTSQKEITSDLEKNFSSQLTESKNEILRNEFDENGFVVQNCSIVLGHNGAFLDTKVCVCCVAFVGLFANGIICLL